MEYFFILGKNYLLSVAEIINLLQYQKVNFAVRDLSSKVLILDIKGEFSPDLFLSRLGGTVKIGKLQKCEFKATSLAKMINIKPTGKISFGFSIYPKEEQAQSKRIEDLRFRIKDISIKIKQELKNAGRSCRWVVSKEKNLSSVTVKVNKLVQNGAEIVLLVGQREVLIGKTLAVQEFDEYSSRDYGREYRDTKSGMIPPKLAKMMINLAGVNLDGTILDPFCGSGTVVQEALLMGYRGVLGSDISEKAVHDSQKNLEWLGDRFKIKDLRFQVIQKDVAALYSWVKPGSVDAIVTEPYLGPTNLKHAKIKRASELGEIKKELVELYAKAFEQFNRVLKPGGRVVMVWPAWQIAANKLGGEKELSYLPLIERMTKLGFKKVNVLPKEIINKYGLKLNDRKSLVYSRPNQVVFREIWIWEKK